jgi:predicted nicotinamide N-methyase
LKPLIPRPPLNPTVVAGYRTRCEQLAFGNINVRVLVVDRLADHVDREALLRDADAPEPPYWAHLWPGSRALARLVATQLECRGRGVVELGCGTGLPGIVAARRGARVVMLDNVCEAARFAATNAELNACRPLVLQADLRRPPLCERFDYCLAADITYDPSLQEAVAVFLAGHLAPRGRGLCAESVRVFDTKFAQACARHGLHVSERSVREPDEEGREVEVRISEVGWP